MSASDCRASENLSDHQCKLTFLSQMPIIVSSWSAVGLFNLFRAVTFPAHGILALNSGRYDGFLFYVII